MNTNPGKVLVIGGAGYLGSTLVAQLIKSNYLVYLLDLFIYDDLESIIYNRYNSNLLIIRADFRELNKIITDLGHINAIIHLGAIVGDSACEVDPHLSIDINTFSTQKIIAIAQKKNIARFIFASSCSIYGCSEQILDEQSSPHPISLYAITKLKSENIIKNMTSSLFAPTILRFSTLFGVSFRMRFDLVVNKLTAEAIFNREISIINGNQYRPFLHVRDAARAIIEILNAPLSIVGNQVYNIGSNKMNYMMDQVGEIIQNCIHNTRITRIKFSSDERNYRVSFDKVKNQLNFIPQKTLENGIDEIINFINEGKVRNHRELKYYNAEYIRKQGMIKLKNYRG